MIDNGNFINPLRLAELIRTGEVSGRDLAVSLAKLSRGVAATWSHYLRFEARRFSNPAQTMPIARAEAQRWCESLCRVFSVRRIVTGERPGTPEWRSRNGLSGGAVVMCNHRTYADVAVVGAEVAMTFVGAKEVLKWPVMGRVVSGSHQILVDRSDPESRRQARQAILEQVATGALVLNFPEGKCNLEPGLLPFNPGLFSSLAGQSVPIVPVTLYYPPELGMEWTRGTGKGFVEHLIEKVSHEIPVKIHFGEVIRPQEDGNAQTLMDLVRARMLEALEVQSTSGW